jgi:glycosyltransferase involved in cell wall biosynthesis
VSSNEAALVSVIVPVGQHHADVGRLYAEYKAALMQVLHPFEFIFVLDGPARESSAKLAALVDGGEPVTVVALSRSFGEATALTVGLSHANGGLILTLPAYNQIVPEEIGLLVTELRNCDVAVAVRDQRKGGPFEKLRRWTFHALLAVFTGHRFRDLGCAARAVRREVLEQLTVYGDQHRFIPVFAQQQGFRVREVEVRQSPFDRRVGVYGPRVYGRRALDLLSVFFLVRFTKKPLRFFGFIGTLVAAAGIAIILLLVAQRLFAREPLADRPALLLACLLVVLGVQLVSLGVLGELIIYTHAKGIKDYHIEEVIQFSDGGGRR